MSVLVEVFPKILSESLLFSRDCEPGCECVVPDVSFVEQLNRDLVRMIASVLEETAVRAEVRLYHYETPDEQKAALQRLGELLEAAGYGKLEMNVQGGHMLELMTPMLCIDGKLCMFATYPTREQFTRTLRSPQASEPS